MRILHIFNLPRHLCQATLGPEHTLKHRMTGGAVIMTVGVGIVVAMKAVPSPFMHFTGELIGFLIHGIGAVPYVEWAVHNDKQDDHGSP